MSEGKLDFDCVEMRKLAIQDKLAPVEELAVMSDCDVLSLITRHYRYLGEDGGTVIFVHKDKYKEVLSMCKMIPRG